MPSKYFKILFSGDSKPLRKEIDQGKKSMEKFTGEATSSFNSMAQAIGVDVNRISGQFNSFKTGVVGLGGAFKGAAAGSGVFTAALKILKVALISTGIGAIVVALGSLVAYFTKSQRGADKLAVFMARLRAAFDVVIDRAVAFGEGVFLLLSGKWKDGAEKLKGAFKGIGEEIREESNAAADLEKRSQALEDREIALITVMGQRKKRIAELRLAAKDETKSAEERRRALQQAIDLEKQNLADEIGIQQERADIADKRTALAESTRDDYRALAEEQNRLNELQTNSLNTQRRLQTEMNTLNNEIARQSEELKKANEEWLKQAGFDNSKLSGTIGNVPNLTPKAIFGDAVDENGVLKLAPPSTQPHVTVAEGIKGVWVNAADAINQSFQNMAVGFGQALGLMIAGEADASALGQVVVGALADMAIQVGQIAIATGIAKLAIDEALVKWGGGVGAIAAGVALVALGTAAKAGLTRAAHSQGAGGTAGIPSSAGTYNGPRAEAQTLHIEVTGALTANVRDMALQLSKENVRVQKV